MDTNDMSPNEIIRRCELSPNLQPPVEQENSRLQKMGGFIVSKWDSVKEFTSNFYQETKEHPVRNTAIAGAFCVTQFLDRTREPFVQLSRVATDHLATGSPYFFEGLANSASAGLMAGGILAGSYMIVGESVSAGLRAYPKTTARFIEKTPRFYKVAKHSTAGIVSSGSTDDLSDESTTRNRVTDKTKNALNLGVQGLALGTAAQAAVSTIEGWSPKETRKLVAKTSLAMGAMAVPIIVGIDAVVDKLILAGHYTLAENIVNYAGNRYVWLGIAAASIGLNYRKNSRIAKAVES